MLTRLLAISVFVISMIVAQPQQRALDERGFLDFLMNLIPLLTSLQNDLKDDLYASVNNPFQHSVAYVRCEKNVIPEQECTWRKQRFTKVKAAQEQFLGMQLTDNEVLDIGISLSGGGFRAMLGSFGSMNITEQTGLLDCVMTIAGLSGSTWFIAPWITQGYSVADRKTYLLDRLKKGIIPKNPDDAQWMIERLMLKFVYGQPLTSVDIYGTLLANLLFDWDPQCSQDSFLYGTINNSMISQCDRISDAHAPFPVYTASLVDATLPPYFFECTPYEVGCRNFNAYVPSWAFGRKFSGAKSSDFAPEQSLGFILGIAGSAFGVQLKQIYLDVIQGHITNRDLRSLLDSLFNSQVGNVRFAYAEINNFMYDMDSCIYNLPRILKLVDAGGEVNNPIFATYRKPPLGSEPDIILVFDYGDGGFGYPELSISATYAKKYGYKFPDITSPNSGNDIITVFKNDQDLTVPVVVYMPSIEDVQLVSAYCQNPSYNYYKTFLTNLDWTKVVSDGYANTLNFFYTKEQAETACALHEFNMLMNVDIIKQTMKDRILTKRATIS